MPTDAQNVLSGFDALAFDDQPPLSDEDLARIADDLFVQLDADEAQRGS